MKSSSLISFAAACLFCVTIGCEKSPRANVVDGLTKVRLQLNWLPDAQFGGYYAAKVSGEYERAGLDVEIIIGGPDAAVLPKLAMRRVEFGLGNADQLLLAQQEGADVTAVLAVMQDNPRCIMVHEASEINSFEKLEGVTLAMGEGNAFAAFLKSKLPLTDVRIVSYAGNVAKFVIDDQFAQQGYVFSEPVVAKSKGAHPRSLMVSDLGFNPYAGIVMTNRKLIEQQPETVARFVQATRRGWLQYLSNPAAANAEIHHWNPEISVRHLDAAVETIRGLCRNGAPDQSKENGAEEETNDNAAESTFGRMSADRWTTLNRQLTELGLVKADLVDLDPSRVFTNQFVESARQSMTPTNKLTTEAK